jgi:hypothetical protein
VFSFLRLFYDQVNNIILPYGHVKCNSKGKDKPILEESGGTREYSEALLHFFLGKREKVFGIQGYDPERDPVTYFFFAKKNDAP